MKLEPTLQSEVCQKEKHQYSILYSSREPTTTRSLSTTATGQPLLTRARESLCRATKSPCTETQTPRSQKKKIAPTALALAHSVMWICFFAVRLNNVELPQCEHHTACDSNTKSYIFWCSIATRIEAYYFTRCSKNHPGMNWLHWTERW